MELIYQLIWVPVISARYVCLIKDVQCNFVCFTKKNQMYIYCIHLFMPLFIIPSQSVFGKSFAKHLAKALRKTSIVYITHIVLLTALSLSFHSLNYFFIMIQKWVIYISQRLIWIEDSSEEVGQLKMSWISNHIDPFRFLKFSFGKLG